MVHTQCNCARLSILYDGASTSFDKSFSSALDNDDVIKFTNSNDNLFIKSNNKNLVVERRPMPTVTDTIKFCLTATRVADYRFKIHPYLLEAINLEAFLVDKYLKTENGLNLLDSNNINFSVSTVAASKDADRFMIVFKPLPITVFTTIAAVRNVDKSATVKWEIKEEKHVAIYTIDYSNDGINFSAIGTQAPVANDGTNTSYNKIDFAATKTKNWYRINAKNRAGLTIYSAVALVDEIIEPLISVYPNPVNDGKINLYLKSQPAGIYTIQITNKAGQVLKTETIKIQSNNEMRTINIGTVVKGTYQIKVNNNASIKTTLTIFVK